MINGFLNFAGGFVEVLLDATDDQLATFHLILTTYVQTRSTNVSGKPNQPDYKRYLQKAEVFLNDSLQETPPTNISFDGLIASQSFMKLFPYALGSRTEAEEWVLLQRIIERIQENYSEIFGDKTFREYFNDVMFFDGDVFSSKAQGLLKDVLTELEKESKEAYKELDRFEKRVDRYRKHWKALAPLIKDMDYLKGMAIHCVYLELCQRYLEPREYSKYQKVMVKAFTAYKTNQNPMQKQFTFKNVNETFEKLKDRVLDRMLEEYNQEFEVSKNRAIFILATDKCVEILSKLSVEKASTMLEEVSFSGDKIHLGESLKHYLDTCSESAKDKYQEMSSKWGEVNKSKDEEDSAESPEVENENEQDTTAEEQKEKGALFADSDKKLSEKIEKLDLVHDIFFHAVALRNLLTQDVPKELYPDYEKVVEKLISDYKDIRTETDKAQQLRTEADRIIPNVYKELISKMLNFKDTLKTEKDAMAILSYIFMIPSFDIALHEIADIDEAALKDILLGYSLDKEQKEYFNEVVSACSYKYLNISTILQKPSLFEGLANNM